MLNTVVKLTSPRNLETFFVEEKYDAETVIERPTYMSICAADQRYYQGNRKKETPSLHKRAFTRYSLYSSPLLRKKSMHSFTGFFSIRLRASL